MQNSIKKLPLIDWLMWFGLGGYISYAGVSILSLPMVVLGGILLTAGYAKFTAKKWAWTAGLYGYIGLGAWALWRVTIVGLNLITITMIIGFAWCIWDHFQERKKFVTDTGEAAAKEDAGEGVPNLSLVLWLREPRYLDESILAAIATRALGESFSGDDDLPHFVVGKDNNHILKYHDSWFLIHNWSQNYFENPEEAADKVKELRRHRAVQTHQAWLAVDFMRADGGPDPAVTLQTIARLISELALDHDDVVAVYYPTTGWIAPWQPELTTLLRSDEPLKIFSEHPLDPVIRVSGDSQELRQGVENALRRWPEFVAAFTRATDKEKFLVKAPVTEAGNTEFIWITVKAIANGQIHGLLANDPVSLGSLKLSDFVSVSENDINDWLCPDPNNPDQPLGLFTVKAINDSVA